MSTYAKALDAYLRRAENKETDLAAAIEKTQPAVNRYRNAERFPDADTARLIDKATGGEVPFEVWQAEFMAKSGLAA